jgi:hypothetical protein
MLTVLAAAMAWGQEAAKPAKAAAAQAETVAAAAPEPKEAKVKAVVQPPPKGELAQVRSVYLMKMGLGLDQYLSQRLVERNIVTVVTDAALADAFFTDHLGRSFEMEFRRLTAVAEEEGDEKSTKEKSDALWEATRSTFGRGRGNIFLVERASGAVLWSLYERPKNGQADEMNRTAGRIAIALQNKIKRASN